MRNENEELEEMLDELDPPYESIEELMIGRLLDEYGIPFFYKQPTIVYDLGKNQVWKPTFTLPNYGGLVIDYVPESADNQRDKLLQREQAYRHNQIPAVVLDPKHLTETDWEERLYEQIEQISYRPIEAANNRSGLL